MDLDPDFGSKSNAKPKSKVLFWDHQKSMFCVAVTRNALNSVLAKNCVKCQNTLKLVTKTMPNLC